jgi:hypothetical protein
LRNGSRTNSHEKAAVVQKQLSLNTMENPNHQDNLFGT